ncbi:hypothetical protein FB451DRAFT_321790 [Mycena latifolia]|nr:hypothetical protein FB451DRAFT_321790 [Mycena latifolia]
MSLSLADSPQSSSYPSLIKIRRRLLGVPKLLPGRNHPYENIDSEIVTFYELRGRGTPPEDVGHPGDIYWDVTFPFILYFRGIEAWQPWNEHADIGSQFLARHPNVAGRYMWFSRARGFNWLTSQGLHISGVDPGVKQTLDQYRQGILVDILFVHPNTTSLALQLGDNQARNDAEVQRRTLAGIAIREAPKPNPRPRRKTTKTDVSSPSQSNTEAPHDLASLDEGMIADIVSQWKSALTEEKRRNSELIENLSAEVETLRADNLRLKLILEDVGRRRNAILIEVEKGARDLKRKYEREMEAMAQRHEALMARHVQAHARIKELEYAHKEAEIASERGTAPDRSYDDILTGPPYSGNQDRQTES